MDVKAGPSAVKDGFIPNNTAPSRVEARQEQPSRSGFESPPLHQNLQGESPVTEETLSQEIDRRYREVISRNPEADPGIIRVQVTQIVKRQRRERDAEKIRLESLAAGLLDWIAKPGEETAPEVSGRLTPEELKKQFAGLGLKSAAEVKPLEVEE